MKMAELAKEMTLQEYNIKRLEYFLFAQLKTPPIFSIIVVFSSAFYVIKQAIVN